jgi:hypothetical protein
MTFDVAAAHPDCLPRFLGSFTAGVFIFTARHHFFRVTPKGGSRWRVRDVGISARREDDPTTFPNFGRSARSFFFF